MDHKKDIGKLFKERLANAEAEPSSALWSQIEETLNKKRKRRGFIWLWMSVLALLTLASILYFNTISTNVSEQNRPTETPPVITDIQQINEKQNKIATKPIINSKEVDDTIDRNTTPIIHKSAEENASTNSNTRTNNIQVVKRQLQSKKEIIQTNDNTDKEKGFERQKNGLEKKSVSYLSNENRNAITTNKDSTNIRKKIKANSDLKDKEEPLSDSIQKKGLDKKKPILTEKENLKKKKDTVNKFLISVQGGPNLFSYLSNTAPFDQNLSSRQLRSGISYSYGALVNIPLTEKFTFRLGYRKTNLKLYLDQAVHNESQSIINSVAIRGNGIPLPQNFSDNLVAPNNFKIEQNIDYHVFPFEILYSLKDDKFKIDALAGASIMTLGNNTINLENDLGNVEIGNASYLRKIAVAPTLGLGFKYQVLKMLSIDIEPMLQYQFNAFESGFKNGNPIIFTINAGTTIKL